MQHGNRHRRFEPPRDMKPGAPETLEALDETRVTDIARWAWERRPEMFTSLPRPVAGRMHQAAELIRGGMLSVDDYLRVLGDPIDFDATSEFTPND